MRLWVPLTLKDNILLNMGESFVVVNLVKEGGETAAPSRLRFVIFGGPSTGEIFYFTEKETKITLGRDEDCEVFIEDGLLSK